MLRWDTEEDDAHVREVFAAPQWQAFHYDTMASRGLYARKGVHVSSLNTFTFTAVESYV